MIEGGTKIVGNWGAGHSYSYGVITTVAHFLGKKRAWVKFDDIGTQLYSEDEFLFSNSIDKIGVYVDHEGLTY